MFRFRRLQRQVNQLHRHQTTSYLNEDGTEFDSWSGGCALPACAAKVWPRRDTREAAARDANDHVAVLNAPLIAAMVSD